jgi:hypothetical protein
LFFSVCVFLFLFVALLLMFACREVIVLLAFD